MSATRRAQVGRPRRYASPSLPTRPSRLPPTSPMVRPTKYLPTRLDRWLLGGAVPMAQAHCAACKRKAGQQAAAPPPPVSSQQLPAEPS